MSLFIVAAAVCCCDSGGGEGEPVTTCPDPPPTPHVATVMLNASATPKAWCVVTSYDCDSPSDYECSGNTPQVWGLTGTSGVDLACAYCPLEVPTAQFDPGITDAKCSVCWSSSLTQTIAGPEYSVSCNECGSEVKSAGDPTSIRLSFSLECGDEQTFGDADVDGISGSIQVIHCCDDCTCDGTGILKCTQIIVTLNARWTQEFTGVPVLTEDMACYDCDGDLVQEARDIKKTGTDTVQIVHTQSTVITFERTVMSVYSTQRIAPGSYTIKRVEVATLNGDQLTYSPNAHASNKASGYYHMTGGDFASCIGAAPTGESEDCTQDLLASYGWTASLVVTA